MAEKVFSENIMGVVAELLSDILRVWFLQQMVEHGDGLWCIASAVWQALVFCLEARYHTFYFRML